MQLTITSFEDKHIIKIGEARLDAVVATAFKDRIREALTEIGPNIVLDLEQVNFMDSSGLGAVIAVLKSLPEGYQLELCNLSPNVERVFRLTHMDSIFKIVPAQEPPMPPLQSGAAVHME
ncbi:STAS domain-containing protein [Paracoccus sp. (in: a-proteobacteria)]|uniref:STAS domain-containing protein n=1 Tax=Paracoccus sp. TaxID=267 RepID=UPI0028A1D3FF|nr:STAS domain-containing protein [Paracoccus sp. (in: a-proteobacteria)]